MPKTIAVHPEGPRYAHSLVFVPGLWARPEAMRAVASFLGHRGWAGLIADPIRAHGVSGAAREVADIAAGLPTPPVLIGHDAGGLVALEAAARVTAAAVVWLAPLALPARQLTRQVGAWRLALALLRGGEVERPGGAAGEALFGSAPTATLRAREAVALVRDVVRGRSPAVSAAAAPVTIVVGEHDALGRRLSVAAAQRLVVPGGRRWLLAGEQWQATAGRIHRRLVRQLGAPNLELYEEAMAERDAPEDQS